MNTIIPKEVNAVNDAKTPNISTRGAGAGRSKRAGGSRGRGFNTRGRGGQSHQAPPTQGVTLESVTDANNKGATPDAGKKVDANPSRKASTRVSVRSDIPAARISEDPWNLKELEQVEMIFTPCTSDVTITATCEGLPSLLRETHTALQNVSSVYAEHISESMLHYYVTVLTQARNAELRALRGSQTVADRRLVDMLQHCQLHLPPHLKRWLEATGDFVDPDNNLVRYVPPERPAQDGSFGRVSAATHTRYETELSPRVAVERIAADVRYTSGEGQRLWDLPEDLRPQEEDGQQPAGLPTGNMLGWHPAVHLTEQQIQLLHHCNIRQDAEGNFEFPHANGDLALYWVNERLIKEIAKFLGASSISMNMNVYSCGNAPTVGTRAQLMYITTRQVTGFDVCTCHTDRATTTHLDVNIDMRLVYLYNAYCLRVKRPEDGPRNWSCYQFNDYQAVPDTWYATRNSCYEFGSSQLWDDPTQYGPELDRRKLVRGLIHSTILKKNSD